MLGLALAGLLLASRPTVAAEAYQPRVLNDVVQAVHAAAATGIKPVVLFDIDDTLTDTAGRQREIMRQFARQPEMQTEEFKADSAKLLKAAETPSDLPYDHHETLRSAGIENPRFSEKYGAFWQLKFFTNDLLSADTPNPGAVEFVKSVVQAGGIAAYFTGREAHLLPGTLAALRKHGFPVPGEDPGARIYLKQDPKQSDVEFKSAQLRQWVRQGVPVVGGFDNEPANVNAFRKEGPADAKMVFVDTKHSPSGVEVDKEIPRIRDFIRPLP